MTSLKQSFQEFRNWEASCYQRTTISEFSSKRNVGGNDSLWYPENRVSQTYHGSDGAKTKKTAGRNPSHDSSAHLPPSGRDCSQPFRLTEKSFALPAVASRRRQSVWTHSINFHHFFGRAMSNQWNAPQKEKKQIISNLNFWAQASKFSCWKVSFHREVTTGSAQPRTISGWFAEIGLAVGTQEFDCWGFIFCAHNIAPRAFCTRNIFSRAAQERFVAHCVSTLKNSSSFSCVMSHSHLLWSDFPPFLLLNTFPLCCILLPVMNNRSIHGQKDGLVDWPYKSPLANYEPNATVEVSSAQVILILLPSRRASFQFSVQIWRGRHNCACVLRSRWEASKGWLHHCSCRREKQVQPLQELNTIMTFVVYA